MNTALGAAKAPVYTELAECQDCYKCIRKCPVKSIKVEKGQANILFDRCIYCGRCVMNCPAHAKHYRNDTEKVKMLLAEGKTIAVSLAPSFVSEFPEWKPEELIAALKKLGFAYVSETALGADFLSSRIAKDLEYISTEGNTKEQVPLMISSACPVIVEYIKLYAPHLAPYISAHASPLLTHARFLRSYYDKDADSKFAVVFIGPCIAKKHEADTYHKEIDAALTFSELREWFDKERITPDTLSISSSVLNDCTFVPRRSAKGALFPIEGGEINAFSSYIKSAAIENGMPIHTLSASGIKAVQEILTGFDPSTVETPLFLELMACFGGCLSGPGMSHTSPGLVRQICVKDYALSAEEILDTETLSLAPSTDADYESVSFTHKTYAEPEIAEALMAVGKYSLSDRLNCASCGYDTCRDFAVALLDGRAEKSMCASYMRKLATKTANALIKAIPSGVVIVDRDLKVIDCNEQFARLLGTEAEELFALNPGLEGADLRKISPFPQYFQAVIDPKGPDLSQTDVRSGNKIFHLTVFAVEKGVTVAGVVEDITAPRVRIETTVERAQELIKKNVSTVQQIAFLLGENAAESESILNSIIESYTAGADGAASK
jgi:iron only hydrogenase large subunit-like protein